MKIPMGHEPHLACKGHQWFKCLTKPCSRCLFPRYLHCFFSGKNRFRKSFCIFTVQTGDRAGAWSHRLLYIKTNSKGLPRSSQFSKDFKWVRRRLKDLVSQIKQRETLFIHLFTSFFAYGIAISFDLEKGNWLLTLFLSLTFFQAPHYT